MWYDVTFIVQVRILVVPMEFHNTSYTHVCAHMYMCVCARVHVCVCVHVHVHVHACVHVCVCVTFRFQHFLYTSIYRIIFCL